MYLVLRPIICPPPDSFLLPQSHNLNTSDFIGLHINLQLKEWVNFEVSQCLNFCFNLSNSLFLLVVYKCIYLLQLRSTWALAVVWISCIKILNDFGSRAYVCVHKRKTYLSFLCGVCSGSLLFCTVRLKMSLLSALSKLEI